MNQMKIKYQILELLADNLNRTQYPNVMDSDIIASELNLPPRKTKDIIKCMRGIGVVESTLDGDYTIITRKGMEYLKQVGKYFTRVEKAA